MTILLIEPDQLLGAVYVRALTRAGHTVTQVHSAQAAIAAADAQRPDMVVLELELAGHSGVAFLQEFRSYIDWLHIPIIVHSGLPPARSAPYARALAQLGVVAMLYKPQTTLRKLVQTINRYATTTRAPSTL